jgi:hypothetical protein
MLSRQKGSNGIPLSYIVGKERTFAPDPTRSYNDDNWSTLNEKLVACAVHEGAKYEQDTNDVFTLIATHFNAIEADSTIKKFKRTRNGKDCWAALKKHFESASSKNILRTEALATIRGSIYNGPKKNFDLSSLYLKHTQAHNMLVEAGLPYTEAQKIQEFQS